MSGVLRRIRPRSAQKNKRLVEGWIILQRPRKLPCGTKERQGGVVCPKNVSQYKGRYHIKHAVVFHLHVTCRAFLSPPAQAPRPSSVVILQCRRPQLLTRFFFRGRSKLDTPTSSTILHNSGADFKTQIQGGGELKRFKPQDRLGGYATSGLQGGDTKLVIMLS